MKAWDVQIIFKIGDSSEYVFEGSQEEARQDAYLSSPLGNIRNVIVTEKEE
jgi:hypothetical protein